MKRYLREMAPLENSSSIQDWSTGGKVFLDYITMVETIDEIQRVRIIICAEKLSFDRGELKLDSVVEKSYYMQIRVKELNAMISNVSLYVYTFRKKWEFMSWRNCSLKLHHCVLEYRN